MPRRRIHPIYGSRLGFARAVAVSSMSCSPQCRRLVRPRIAELAIRRAHWTIPPCVLPPGAVLAVREALFQYFSLCERGGLWRVEHGTERPTRLGPRSFLGPRSDRPLPWATRKEHFEQVDVRKPRSPALLAGEPLALATVSTDPGALAKRLVRGPGPLYAVRWLAAHRAHAQPRLRSTWPLVAGFGAIVSQDRAAHPSLSFCGQQARLSLNENAVEVVAKRDVEALPAWHARLMAVFAQALGTEQSHGGARR